MPSYNAHYKTLQVSTDADTEVIEAAYKALIKKHHPDRHPAGPSAGERVASDLNRAWHVLRDPDRRAAYDAEEKARQERHKVELARAFPETVPGRAVEPVRRPPVPPAPARKGQRIAAGVGLLGIGVLVGAIVLMARGSGGLDAKLVEAAPAVAAEAVARLPGLPGMDTDFDEAAFRALPVNRQQVFTAVAEFKRISDRGGLPAAARFSEKCFADQARSRGLGEFDFCVAFDHAAGRTDLLPNAPDEPRFQPQTAMARHIQAAATSLSKDTTIIEARLFEIRRVTDSALADLDPRLAQLAEVPEPVAAPVRVLSRPRPAERAARPPQRRAPARAEPTPQDFLEREGGIY
jgi:curved DNA-binding protein CbpA